MEKLRLRWASYAEKFVHMALLGGFIKWIILGSGIGVLTGTASAFFLISLDHVTNLRMQPLVVVLIAFRRRLGQLSVSQIREK